MLSTLLLNGADVNVKSVSCVPCISVMHVIIAALASFIVGCKLHNAKWYLVLLTTFSIFFAQHT